MGRIVLPQLGKSLGRSTGGGHLARIGATEVASQVVGMLGMAGRQQRGRLKRLGIDRCAAPLTTFIHFQGFRIVAKSIECMRLVVKQKEKGTVDRTQGRCHSVQLFRRTPQRKIDQNLVAYFRRQIGRARQSQAQFGQDVRRCVGWVIWHHWGILTQKSEPTQNAVLPYWSHVDSILGGWTGDFLTRPGYFHIMETGFMLSARR